MLFLGTDMPRGGNIAAQVALKREKEEARRAQTKVAAIHSVASRSQTSPLGLSEPHANTDFLDIPCTPVASTTPAAAESFDTPAATLPEADAAPVRRIFNGGKFWRVWAIASSFSRATEEL